jgi:hypothetical protein
MNRDYESEPLRDDEIISQEDSNTQDTNVTPPADSSQTDSNDSSSSSQPNGGDNQKPHHRLKEWFIGLEQWQKMVVTVVPTLIVIAFVALAIAVSHGHKAQPVAVVKNAPHKAIAKSNTVPSTLTGLQVDPSVNKRQVTGVMIENSTFARPQSGLDQAGVVFEAEAEGGVTRFLALFQDSQPGYLGPVRSVRPYYIQWCQSFDCAIAHVGGSPDALQDLKDWGVKNLDQFAGAGYFHRVSSRAAPHNMYTSISQLNAYEAKRGYTGSSYTGFIRAAKAGAPATTPVASISFNYGGTAYDVHYDYDKASNSYKRSEGGAVHNVVDASGTTTQLAPKVVIAMVVPKSQGALDASGAYYSNYQVLGSGTAVVFQHGVAVHGTWTKASATGQITFLDDSGKTLQLDPGQTWITVLDNASAATYN